MSKMDTFLPSEVARLVYGYLEEEGCTSAAQKFLNTSVHLQECLNVVKKGRKFHTKIMGRNLIEILDLLSEVSVAVNEISDNINWTTPGYDKIHYLLKLLQYEEGPRLLTITSASSGSITSTVDESIGDTQNDISRRKEDVSGAVAKENKTLHVKLPEDINEEIESSRDHDEGSKGEGGSSVENHKVVNENQALLSIRNLGDIKPKQEPLNITCSITNNLTGGGSGDMIPDSVSGMRLLTTIKQDVEPTHLSSQLGDQMGGGCHAGVVVTPQNILSVQAAPWSNMLHMYQPTATISQTSMPAVYMRTTVPVSQPNQVIFRHENLPAIVSAPTASVPHQATAWAKPQPQIINTVQVKRNVQSVTESKPVIGQKKHKANHGRPTPKLRPIAPKITQLLDSGIEVQVMPTKDNPLADYDAGSQSPTITKKSLRSRSSDSSPPSPLFVDIHDIDDDKN